MAVTQENTIEAWVKFDEAFSANSHEGPYQTIVYKGQYQIYYNNQTGKLVYELSNNAADNWQKVGGGDDTILSPINNSWDRNGKLGVTASVAVGTDIYITLGTELGDAEVWKWNGTIWSLVGGNGLNSSWPACVFEDIYAIESEGNDIYVGLGDSVDDAEVWKFDISEKT